MRIRRKNEDIPQDYSEVLRRLNSLKQEIEHFIKLTNKLLEENQYYTTYYNKMKLKHCCICGKEIFDRDNIFRGCYLKEYDKMICEKHYWDIKKNKETEYDEPYYLVKGTQGSVVFSESELIKKIENGSVLEMFNLFSGGRMSRYAEKSN